MSYSSDQKGSEEVVIGGVLVLFVLVFIPGFL